VGTKIRFSYDAMVAGALTTIFALVVALIAAVIVGSNAPNLPVAIVVFVLAAVIQVFRWRRGLHRLA
jgi:membrane protein implicated in regulation of membrane protease activity